MSVFEIIVPQGLTYHSQTTRLGLDTFGLTFRWNERAQIWFMDVADRDNIELLKGLPLKVGVGALILYLTRPGVPVGDIVPFDTSLQNMEAGRDDLGQRVKLYFYDALELVTLL